MGRKQFSAPEESPREKRRKAVLQIQYTVLAGFFGALIATSGLEPILLAAVTGLLVALPFLTNRYWEDIHRYWPGR